MGARLARHSDLLLAALVISIVGMMIIPLPTALLDILLTTNISIAIILLMVAIYVENALRIAAFPSILLISTLFRLGLNVSSTRLILVQANAGTVIASFGGFVVAGNLVVGAVVFLILTIIQFVVIAKGSERVAEVAARFTLDALPGKQMAIDADLRGGAIELPEARRLRASLQRESQLYGSMDGAMKFVKGDAIAGILITLINIIGGLLIGVFQRNMELSDAARVYSLLTIGDGLVSQIPALLISISAGVVVTRVASEDEGSHLGRDIGRQVMAQPRAIAIAAALLLVLAAIPGLPTVPFIILGLLLAALAYALISRRKQTPARRSPSAHAGADVLTTGTDGDDIGPTATMLAPISLELGNEAMSCTTDGTLLNELIPGLREMLLSELGVPLPSVQVRANPLLEPAQYRILVNDVPTANGTFNLARRLVVAEAEDLARLNIDGAETSAPGLGGSTFSISLEHVSKARAAGLQVVEPQTQLTLHLGHALRASLTEFIGIQDTQQLLDQLELSHPTLVHEVVPKVVSIQLLSEVLRRLVEEGQPIRNLRQILETLAQWGQNEKDPVTLTEHVRGGLRRYISYRHTDESGVLRAILLDPLIEDTVRESIQQASDGTYLALEPELASEIISAVGSAYQTFAAHRPVIVTAPDVRRYLRRLLETDLPNLPVLSHAELEPTVALQPLTRVKVGAA
ncbi:MAG: type III secretion system export apparatus subunit SctV [Deltaproteobacteria bacterium]|nr:type III secretion system export apparatus subunit SctV [Deltaproteobacteria bacterium]